jgi:hypothetical protein
MMPHSFIIDLAYSLGTLYPTNEIFSGGTKLMIPLCSVLFPNSRILSVTHLAPDVLMCLPAGELGGT